MRGAGRGKMRILILHNRYAQRGGEDVVVARERNLLTGFGHQVKLHLAHNEDIGGAWDQIRVGCRAVYSTDAREQVAAEINRFHPDVVHVHNFFPVLTPSVYDAARTAKIPVVQSLHNYRLLCLNGVCMRNGHICEDCLRRPVPWPGVVHACYRGSRLASGAAAAMLTAHRVLRTWTAKVDVYVALTEFGRDKFIQGGLPADKIVVKPNFVAPDPGQGEGRGGYALFVGRIAAEKGVKTLLAAWQVLGGRIPLKIIGSGPLGSEVMTACHRTPGIEWLGHLPPVRVRSLMKEAMVLVCPSIWHEPFGLVVAEAYAVGLPVIASGIGSLTSLVHHGRTGLHFRTGSARDLADAVAWLAGRPRERAAMRREARAEFERTYTAEHNYRRLMEVYAKATGNAATA